MKASKLLDYKQDLERGLIIRCKGKYPYEEVVDFLIADSYDDHCGYSLWVISGYKAGLKLVTLPKDSIPVLNEGYAIDKKWLIKNWDKWGYVDCSIEDVWIVEMDLPSYPNQY